MAKAVKQFGPVRAGALVGVVLAGGEGRRMGPGPLKPLRPLGGRPMVAHVVERLRPQVMDLVVVANDPSPIFRRLKVPVIADPPDIRRAARREGRRLGPLAGILADVFAPDEQLPREMQEKALREGFVRLDADGFFAADRYIFPEHIDRVEGDSLVLAVRKDDLLKV